MEEEGRDGASEGECLCRYSKIALREREEEEEVEEVKEEEEEEEEE